MPSAHPAIGPRQVKETLRPSGLWGADQWGRAATVLTGVQELPISLLTPPSPLAREPRLIPRLSISDCEGRPGWGVG